MAMGLGRMRKPMANCSIASRRLTIPGASCSPMLPPQYGCRHGGFHRVLRVSRTIADLAGADQVGRIHVAEALSYRRQAPRN